MIGSLGLFKQLSALGRAARGSAVDLNKRAARLPPEIREKFKSLRAAEKAKIDAARANAIAEYEQFLSKYGAPPRPNYSKQRKVVAAFVFGESDRGDGVESDGMVLRVDGRNVATRENATDRFVTVCPGEFNEAKASRRAANAVLDILGAGLRVDDRGENAIIHSNRKRSGNGVVSPSRCYKVEVNRKIRNRAADALMGEELIGQSSLLPIRAPKSAAGKSQAQLLAELREKYGRSMSEVISERAGDVAGLGRMHRRRRSRR